MPLLRLSPRYQKTGNKTGIRQKTNNKGGRRSSRKAGNIPNNKAGRSHNRKPGNRPNSRGVSYLPFRKDSVRARCCWQLPQS